MYPKFAIAIAQQAVTVCVWVCDCVCECESLWLCVCVSVNVWMCVSVIAEFCTKSDKSETVKESSASLFVCEREKSSQTVEKVF